MLIHSKEHFKFGNRKHTPKIYSDIKSWGVLEIKIKFLAKKIFYNKKF